MTARRLQLLNGKVSSHSLLQAALELEELGPHLVAAAVGGGEALELLPPGLWDGREGYSSGRSTQQGCRSTAPVVSRGFCLLWHSWRTSNRRP